MFPGHHSGAGANELAALYDEFIHMPDGAARDAGFEAETADTDYVAVIEEHAAGASTAEAVEKHRLLCELAEGQAGALLGRAWQERHAAAIATVAGEAAGVGRIVRIAAEVAAAEAMNLIGERLAKASGSQVVA